MIYTLGFCTLSLLQIHWGVSTWYALLNSLVVSWSNSRIPRKIWSSVASIKDSCSLRIPLRTNHKEGEQNGNTTRIILTACHIFTQAFWPLWSVCALCHMGTSFGAFYLKNCHRMPTHSSTVYGLRVLADPSQYNINHSVACTLSEEIPCNTVHSCLRRQNKMGRITNSYLSSVLSSQGQHSCIPKVSFLPHLLGVALVCVGGNHY